MTYMIPPQTTTPDGVPVRVSTTHGLLPNSYEMRDGEIAVNSSDGKIYVKSYGALVCLSDRYANSTLSVSPQVATLQSHIINLQSRVIDLEMTIKKLEERLPPPPWMDKAVEEFEKGV